MEHNDTDPSSRFVAGHLDNCNAFPGTEADPSGGLSKLEYVAAQIAGHMAADPDRADQTPWRTAQHAVLLARAVLAECRKRPEK